MENRQRSSQKKLLANREPGESTPEPVRQSDDSSAKPKQMPSPGKDFAANSIPSKGALYPVNPKDISWTPILDLQRELSLKYTLQPGQETWVQFNYLLEDSDNPKWYRFVATVAPPVAPNVKEYW